MVLDQAVALNRALDHAPLGSQILLIAWNAGSGIACPIEPRGVARGARLNPRLGFRADKTRLFTGSLGALEATVQTERAIDSLSELDEAWAKLAKIEAHREWGKKLEPLVVSGTSHWEVYRVL